MSISMKRYNDTIITPKDDRILFDQIFDDYGLIYGGSATMAASNKIHVGAARGFVKGTEVIIEAEDIAVNLSDSGTKNGRLKIVMDLADTETPIKFESEVAASFPALEQDANINYDNGRYEVVFATYKATETTISSVTLVMPTMQSVKAKIQGISQSLTINNVNFNLDYQNGKYGWNESSERGADTFHPFKSAEYDLLYTYGGEPLQGSLNIKIDKTKYDYIVVGLGYSTGEHKYCGYSKFPCEVGTYYAHSCMESTAYTYASTRQVSITDDAIITADTGYAGINNHNQGCAPVLVIYGHIK